jgi:hypothetical protein
LDQEVNFTDLAAKPFAIRAEVSATKMLLHHQSVLLEADSRTAFYTALQKAIHEDDFEVFVHTLELYEFYEFAGVTLWPNALAHQLAVELDRADMVNELIRRTGVGISYPYVATGNLHNTPKAVERPIYLGLKVGGKRRVEIMEQDHSETRVIQSYGLLSEAITNGSIRVIKYLAGPQPLTAYTYYAETHSDGIAQYLKNVENLEAALPEFLGWKVDESIESPLFCAVKSNKLDILKQLFALKPDLMEEALHQRYGSFCAQFTST